MQYGTNTRERPGFRVVDADDLGVSVRAVQNLCVQHAAHLNVIDEGRVALGQLDRIDLSLWFANDVGFGDFRARHDARCQWV